MKLTPAQLARLQFLEVDGRITASVIVADAKRPDSPLHTLFDWNVEHAAEQHWLSRAREIARVRLIEHTETVTYRMPYAVRDPVQPPTVQGYITTRKLREDRELARQHLRQEVQRIIGCVQRARNLAASCGLTGEVDDLLERFAGLQRILGPLPGAHDEENGDHTPPPS